MVHIHRNWLRSLPAMATPPPRPAPPPRPRPLAGGPPRAGTTRGAMLAKQRREDSTRANRSNQLLQIVVEVEASLTGLWGINTCSTFNFGTFLSDATRCVLSSHDLLHSKFFIAGLLSRLFKKTTIQREKITTNQEFGLLTKKIKSS